MTIADGQRTDFKSKVAMENDGWAFNWQDRNVFDPGDDFCLGVPSTSYCGFRYPGQGTITYTFQNGGSGVAILQYGQSWDSGSVIVSKNDVVIESRDKRGYSEITFDYTDNDILRITEIDDSVINIHGLFLWLIGKLYLHFVLNMIFE